jgi:phosphoadenosine phosphosulfate reductase
MQQTSRTFSPGQDHIFWCHNCNLPLLSEQCVCGRPADRIVLSPPADIRLCSSSARALLKKLFDHNYGFSDFLDERIILLNKIAGIDRRDQVIMDGLHLATLWFDITDGKHKIDLEPFGAMLLAQKAKKNIVVCREHLLKGHLKGKWLKREQIESQPEDLAEGDNLIIKMGKFVGIGVVRKRDDGSKSIRIKDVSQKSFELNGPVPSLEDVINANSPHLKGLEKEAIRELKGYLSKTRLPVNVSFSGGKDSLASLCLCKKIISGPEVLFINTHLEFPETLEYVREFCRAHKLKLHEIEGGSNFFEQTQNFGPPAKDFRWCCKTNKLGPMTSFIQEHYPKGCVTIEGRRIFESFNRAAIKAVERNPYVPNQTTLSPIRNWRALEVMLYIHMNKLALNPLYEQDFERIGCWPCPASMQSEFASLKDSHPRLHAQWTASLQDWAKERNLDQRYIDWGFWRWKKHPPKMVEMAHVHGIDLNMQAKGMKEIEEISLQVIRGRSPCGLDYSIEAIFCAPQCHPFPIVAGALIMLGDVNYSEELGAANIRTKKGKVTAFADGHLMIIAPKAEAEELLQDVIETILRVQLCTRCKICEKNCHRGAIEVKDAIAIDPEACNRCGKCAKGCIAMDRASKIFRDLIAPRASS